MDRPPQSPEPDLNPIENLGMCWRRLTKYYVFSHFFFCFINFFVFFINIFINVDILFTLGLVILVQVENLNERNALISC